jgi:hypothetical protein
MYVDVETLEIISVCSLCSTPIVGRSVPLVGEALYFVMVDVFFLMTWQEVHANST